MDQVYRIGDVRDQVLAMLRKERGAVSAGAICLRLQLPYWAVKAGIEAGVVGDLIVYVAGEGYRVAGEQAVGVVS